MDKNKIMKNIYTLLSTLLVLSAVFVIFLYNIIKPNKYITYLIVILWFLSSIFFKPFVDRFKRGAWVKKTKNILFGECIISFIFVISSYRLFVSSNLNIELAMYSFIISFIFLILMAFYIQNYNHKKPKETFKIKCKQLLKSNLFIIICIGVFIISFFNIYDSKKVIYLKNLKKPNKINIVKMDENTNDPFELKYRVIEERGIIEEIYKELNGKEVNNVRNAEKINHIKLTKNKNYYLICPVYDEKNTVSLEKEYFNFIAIYPEGYVTIEKFKKPKNIFDSNFESYKIHLSYEIIDKLILNYSLN